MVCLYKINLEINLVYLLHLYCIPIYLKVKFIFVDFFHCLLIFIINIIFIKTFFESFRITIISKIPLPRMSSFHIFWCFYRTPILLCSTGYFYSIRKKSIYPRTIKTISFLNNIEIIKIPSIIDYIIFSFYKWNSIKSKTSLLINN